MSTKWHKATTFARSMSDLTEKQYALAFVNWKFSGQGNGDPLPQETLTPQAAKKIRNTVETILEE